MSAKDCHFVISLIGIDGCKYYDTGYSFREDITAARLYDNRKAAEKRLSIWSPRIENMAVEEIQAIA